MKRAEPNSSGRRGQAGITLLETLLAMSIGIIIFVPFTAWAIVSIQQQVETRETNVDTFGLGITNTYFPRDIANSKLAVSQTATDGSMRPAGDIVDCIGGDGSGGTVIAAVITAGNRRVVYSTNPDPNGPGLELWRRECPNLSLASDATFNEAAKLNADMSLNPGHIAPSTPGNNGTAISLARRIESISGTCPTTSGLGQATDCSTIKFSAHLVGRQRSVVIDGTRRIDSYYPPNTPPRAEFILGSYPVEAGIPVDLDASASVDLRGESLTYHWTIGGVALAATVEPVLAHTFPTTGSVVVELIVRNESGLESARSLKTVNVVTARPSITITGTPVAIRNSPWQPQATYQAYGTGNTLGNLTIDWGDGSPTTTIGSCVGQVTCTPTLPTHTYAAGGSRIVNFSVVDSIGQSRSVVQIVATEGEIYYASTTGTDNATCGVSTSPCKSISYTLTRAQSTGRTQVHVAAGTYARFDLVGGVSVTGGFSSDFLSNSASPTKINASAAGGAWSAIRANGVSGSTAISRMELIGGTTGSANSQVLLVENGSNNVTFDHLSVTGGTGRHATGALVTSGSTVTFTDSTFTSGTPTGSGDSAYGVRVIGGSNVTINGGTITASGGVAGANSNHGAPGAVANGCTGGNGGNASGPSDPGSGAGACASYGDARNPGAGGRGGKYSGGGAGGGNGGGGASGGSGGSGSTTGCAFGGSCPHGGGGSGGGGGAKGSAGSAGTHALGSISDLYVPTLGGTGGKGGVGGGGGGGGGGRSASASGGGGGTGGAGGEGGNGATGGGAGAGGSFGVYSNNATITLNNVTVTAVAGGKGGNGSVGGTSGSGGNGTTGGSKSCCRAGGGGGGGGGGSGGGGGGAGGGAGGPSVSVYHNGSGTMAVSGGTRTRAGTSAGAGSGGNGGGTPNGGGAGSGTEGGHNGGGGGKGVAGDKGNDGQAGQLFRQWNNGVTVA